MLIGFTIDKIRIGAHKRIANTKTNLEAQNFLPFFFTSNKKTSSVYFLSNIVCTIQILPSRFYLTIDRHLKSLNLLDFI